MGIFDILRHEFIDIIEWTDETIDTILRKFPRYDHEIKMNVKLTVRESLVVLFLAVNGTQSGLFLIEQLQAMLEVGQFNRSSLVWTQGMSA